MVRIDTCLRCLSKLFKAMHSVQPALLQLSFALTTNPAFCTLGSPSLLSLTLRMLCCSKCPVENTYTASAEVQPIGQVAVRANPFLNRRPNDCSSQSYQVCRSPMQPPVLHQ